MKKCINDLNFAIKMAKKSALLDGYNHVIIKNKQGEYSHSREYENCCLDWYGKIIGRVILYWKYGILKCCYAEKAEDKK